MNIIIRAEIPKDFPAIKRSNDLAFKQINEGELIEKLRLNPDFIPELSLVAELDNEVVGHILFFPIKVKSESKTYDSLALAPMSVLPDFQNKGVGSELVRKGLETAKKHRHQSVIVLGHDKFYPCFGFITASKFDIRAPFEVPDEVFMAIELATDGLKSISGIVEYPKEFNEV